MASARTCATCGKPLTKSAKGRWPKTHPGECRRIYSRAYWNRYRREHREYRAKINARQLRYWHTNSKYRARLTAYMRDYMRRRRAAARA